MRHDVFILNSDKRLDSFISNNIYKNIHLNQFSNFKDIKDELKYADVLIFHINYIDSFLKIKKYLNSKVAIIYIICDNTDLAKIATCDLHHAIIYENFDDNTLKEKIITLLYHTKQESTKNQNMELSQTIVNNIKYPVFSLNKDRIIFSNKYFFELTNTKSIEELNKKFFETDNVFIQDSSKPFRVEDIKENSRVYIKNKKGSKKLFSIQKIPLSHKDTFLIILNDISYEIEHKKELIKLLYTDNLTKLPNRAKLIEDLQNQNLSVQAIALLNINSFKEVNDFFGHKVGDTILKNIAQLLAQQIKNKKNFTLYKFPADNYCITYNQDNKEEFIEFIKDALKQIDDTLFSFEHYEIDIKMRSGISFSDKNNKLITADIALENAKKSFKDFVIFYDELDAFQQYENNMLWTRKLKSAFINDNIEVFFQPLINNKTLKVEKYECLVRLIDEGNVVTPFYFLDISKKSNQYTKLTRTVIAKSIQKFKDLDFDFSVNISYQDIEEPSFLDFIKENITKYNVASRIIFEILEDESIKNYQIVASFIEEVKKLGCKIAIDDFGSGYSNFGHLLKMKADYLKIDASIIKNIAKDENSYKITKTIIEFAKNLNLKTIAEFVENVEIFSIVKELGVDYSQGYFFSAPTQEPNMEDFSK